MFVRWKHRPARRRRETSPAEERVLYAVLVESHRVDGKPRQRFVRYLAAIRGGQLVYPLSTDRFWSDVDSTLTDLALSDDQRQTIEEKIAATVPRPDPSVVEQQRIEVGALAKAIAAMCTSRSRPRRRAKQAATQSGEPIVVDSPQQPAGSGASRKAAAEQAKVPEYKIRQA